MNFSTNTRSDQVNGILLMLIAVMLFAFMDAAVKWLGADYPISQILFFRCVVALIPITGFIYHAGGLAVLKTKRPFVHLLRCVVGMSAMYFIFSAFTVMRLPDAVAILFSAPLFMTALAIPILGEKVGIRRWSAILVGFVGVIIIVNPGAGIISAGALYALAGSLAMAMAMIIVRHLSSTEHPVAITLYFTLSGALIGLVLVMVEGWITPPLFDLGLLIMVGLLGGFAQFAMTKAFRHTEVALVAPIEYSAIIWTTLLSYFIWDDFPETRVWVGITIIVLSGFYMVRRESALSLSRKRKLPKLRIRG